jgi:capsular polysaccharide transport system permease protein
MSNSLVRRRFVSAADIVDYNVGLDRWRGWFFRRGLIVLVAMPTLLATIYYGLVASERYVSEARFIVRSVSAGPRMGGLDLVARTLGISRAVDDTEAVNAYLLSRDAVRDLAARVPLRASFSPSGADSLSRFPPPWRKDTFEALYDYYLDRVSLIPDRRTGVTLLSVTAFQPDDARLIAEALLTLAEAMVNRLNERALTDSVSEARSERERAERRLLDVQRQLTLFRDAELMVDPLKNSSSLLETITTLAEERAQAAARLTQLEKSAPESPVVGTLRAQIAALEGEIVRQRKQLGGDDGSIAPKVAAYEQLTLERDLAEKAVAIADKAFEDALQDARRKQIYVERVAGPSLPDEDTEPHRLRGIAAVAMMTLGAFAVIWILLIGAKEHAQ